MAGLAADHAIINVNGVFYRVFMPGSILGTLGRSGDKVRVHTFMYIREDQMALYGSPDERQVELFETLLAVSGIGPKAALSILSTMPSDALENAIASGNVDLLTRVPGIGKKTASRLVLELKGKMEFAATSNTIGDQSVATDVIDALVGLGYTPAEIQAALSGISKEDQLSTEDMVLYALKSLGR